MYKERNTQKKKSLLVEQNSKIGISVWLDNKKYENQIKREKISENSNFYGSDFYKERGECLEKMLSVI